VLVISAVNDQVRPDPAVFVSIRPRRQLVQFSVPVIVEVHGELAQREHWLQVGLETDPEAMDERQLVSVRENRSDLLGWHAPSRRTRHDQPQPGGNRHSDRPARPQGTRRAGRTCNNQRFPLSSLPASPGGRRRRSCPRPRRP
jgi:hypothetical protein